ncbi:hypothetical protein [Bordetella sp. 02P26C-1]|uniref:hypothetical protein n=1 Tax=Bordetella sp. 02P26C-1 TaxID=2683195 RepID=UPI001352DAE0|nr:hypothetical protein [Bordetella sp. 02P26C-1]MVW78287.1 hypothetical protein [Bordetella sp. 02P26C-1]
MTDPIKPAVPAANREGRPAHPDPNRGAPRPRHTSDEETARPDMDHPPRAQGGDRPAFDRGTDAADEAARNGGISREGNFTPPDTGRDDPGRKGGRTPPGGES